MDELEKELMGDTMDSLTHTNLDPDRTPEQFAVRDSRQEGFRSQLKPANEVFSTTFPISERRFSISSLNTSRSLSTTTANGFGHLKMAADCELHSPIDDTLTESCFSEDTQRSIRSNMGGCPKNHSKLDSKFSPARSDSSNSLMREEGSDRITCPLDGCNSQFLIRKQSPNSKTRLVHDCSLLGTRIFIDSSTSSTQDVLMACHHCRQEVKIIRTSRKRRGLDFHSLIRHLENSCRATEDKGDRKKFAENERDRLRGKLTRISRWHLAQHPIPKSQRSRVKRKHHKRTKKDTKHRRSTIVQLELSFYRTDCQQLLGQGLNSYTQLLIREFGAEVTREDITYDIKSMTEVYKRPSSVKIRGDIRFQVEWDDEAAHELSRKLKTRLRQCSEMCSGAFDFEIIGLRRGSIVVSVSFNMVRFEGNEDAAIHLLKERLTRHELAIEGFGKPEIVLNPYSESSRTLSTWETSCSACILKASVRLQNLSSALDVLYKNTYRMYINDEDPNISPRMLVNTRDQFSRVFAITKGIITDSDYTSLPMKHRMTSFMEMLAKYLGNYVHLVRLVVAYFGFDVATVSGDDTSVSHGARSFYTNRTCSSNSSLLKAVVATPSPSKRTCAPVNSKPAKNSVGTTNELGIGKAGLRKMIRETADPLTSMVNSKNKSESKCTRSILVCKYKHDSSPRSSQDNNTIITCAPRSSIAAFEQKLNSGDTSPSPRRRGSFKGFWSAFRGIIARSGARLSTSSNTPNSRRRSSISLNTRSRPSSGRSSRLHRGRFAEVEHPIQPNVLPSFTIKEHAEMYRRGYLSRPVDKVARMQLDGGRFLRLFNRGIVYIKPVRFTDLGIHRFALVFGQKKCVETAVREHRYLENPKISLLIDISAASMLVNGKLLEELSSFEVTGKDVETMQQKIIPFQSVAKGNLGYAEVGGWITYLQTTVKFYSEMHVYLSPQHLHPHNLLVMSPSLKRLFLIPRGNQNRNACGRMNIPNSTGIKRGVYTRHGKTSSVNPLIYK